MKRITKNFMRFCFGGTVLGAVLPITACGNNTTTPQTYIVNVHVTPPLIQYNGSNEQNAVVSADSTDPSKTIWYTCDTQDQPYLSFNNDTLTLTGDPEGTVPVTITVHCTDTDVTAQVTVTVTSSTTPATWRSINGSDWGTDISNPLVQGTDYSISNGTVTYSGTNGVTKPYSGHNVSIPDYVSDGTNVYKVKIGNYAFYEATLTGTLSFGDEIDSIGNRAFVGCQISGLDLSNFKGSIDTAAFFDCSLLNVSNVLIPSVEWSIGGNEYEPIITNSFKCIVLKPNGSYNYGETFIAGSLAFGRLTYVELACMGYTKYQTIGYDNATVQPINGLFSYCSGINEIDLTGFCGFIGESVFAYCTSLNQITIPDTITGLGARAFFECTNLIGAYEEDNKISFTTDNVYYIRSGLSYFCLGSYKNVLAGSSGILPESSIIIHGNTKVICGNAFEDCDGITSVDLPNSVVCIGRYSFIGCTQLVGSDVSGKLYTDTTNGITYISNNTNSYCVLMEAGTASSVTFKANLKVFADECVDTLNTSELVIPASVIHIGNYAFERPSLSELNLSLFTGTMGCKIISNYNYDMNLTLPNDSWIANGISYFPYTNVNSRILLHDDKTAAGSLAVGDITINELHSCGFSNSIPDNCFTSCPIKSVEFDNNFTYIGRYAFKNTPILNVTGTTSVIYLGAGCFDQCTYLVSLSFGDYITYWANDALRSCRSLTTIGTTVLGNNIMNINNPNTYIGANCFFGVLFDELNIKADNVSILDYAFARNYQLEEVNFAKDKNQTAQSTICGLKISGELQPFFQCSSLTSTYWAFGNEPDMFDPFAGSSLSEVTTTSFFGGWDGQPHNKPSWCWTPADPYQWFAAHDFYISRTNISATITNPDPYPSQPTADNLFAYAKANIPGMNIAYWTLDKFNYYDITGESITFTVKLDNNQYWGVITLHYSVS